MPGVRLTTIVVAIVLLSCLACPVAVAAFGDVNADDAQPGGYGPLVLAASANIVSDAGPAGGATGLPTPAMNGTIPPPPANASNTSAPATQPNGAGSPVLVASLSILAAVGTAGVIARRRDRDD